MPKKTSEDIIEAMRREVEEDVARDIKDDGALMLFMSEAKIGFNMSLISCNKTICVTSKISTLVKDGLENGWEDKQILALIEDLRKALRLAEKQYEAHRAK